MVFHTASLGETITRRKGRQNEPPLRELFLYSVRNSPTSERRATNGS